MGNYMVRQYINKNVYEAFLDRMQFIFQEFENIFVSFSGGKDSGLLLNMVLDFRNTYAPNRRIGIFHQDFEAQYTVTSEYVERTFERMEREKNVDLYWVCLPMATRTCFSSYQMYWYPWDDKQQEIWVRPMPKKKYVINMRNNPITTYRYRMHQEDLARQFGRWYRLSHGNRKSVSLLGVRANESLQRYSGIINKKYGYKDQCWITRQFKDTYAASPFNDYAKDSLNLYRVIDPAIWARLVGRVQGANFGAIYGKTKAMAYHSLSLPKGHTWESYTKFLLDTLPSRLRKNYIKKFQTSIEFWHKTGGGLEEETIKELIEHGYHIRRNGVSNYTVMRNSRIIFLDSIPDDTDDIKSTKDIPSWKRMCYCILKNDHTCRFMGFGLTREQQKQVDSLKEKYRQVVRKDGI